jgi:cytochrome c-type biogenesis protein
MATQQDFTPDVTSNSRWLLYTALGALAMLPIVFFAVGPMTSTSFSLQGPGGPMIAFSAGVLSFVSPCVLPIVPIYITHLSGASVQAGRLTADRRVTFSHAVAFVAGLSIVFIALGASVGLLGSYALRDNQRGLEEFAGVMLLLMGVILIPARARQSPLAAAIALLAFTGVFFFIVQLAGLEGQTTRLALLGGALLVAWLKVSGWIQLSLFSRTFEFNVARDRRVGYTRSGLIGGAFALGWTPCVGPILGSILTLAASTSASTSDALTATYLLAFYSMGFSIPFLITGLALSDVTRFLKRINPYLGYIEVASAVLLIGLGILLVTGQLASLNQYFTFADFNQGL